MAFPFPNNTIAPKTIVLARPVYHDQASKTHGEKEHIV
jgi:hypothetical protein